MQTVYENMYKLNNDLKANVAILMKSKSLFEKSVTATVKSIKNDDVDDEIKNMSMKIMH